MTAIGPVMEFTDYQDIFSSEEWFNFKTSSNNNNEAKSFDELCDEVLTLSNMSENKSAFAAESSSEKLVKDGSNPPPPTHILSQLTDPCYSLLEPLKQQQGICNVTNGKVSDLTSSLTTNTVCKSPSTQIVDGVETNTHVNNNLTEEPSKSKQTWKRYKESQRAVTTSTSPKDFVKKSPDSLGHPNTQSSKFSGKNYLRNQIKRSYGVSSSECINNIDKIKDLVEEDVGIKSKTKRSVISLSNGHDSSFQKQSVQVECNLGIKISKSKNTNNAVSMIQKKQITRPLIANDNRVRADKMKCSIRLDRHIISRINSILNTKDFVEDNSKQLAEIGFDKTAEIKRNQLDINKNKHSSEEKGVKNVSKYSKIHIRSAPKKLLRSNKIVEPICNIQHHNSEILPSISNTIKLNGDNACHASSVHTLKTYGSKYIPCKISDKNQVNLQETEIAIHKELKFSQPFQRNESTSVSIAKQGVTTDVKNNNQNLDFSLIEREHVLDKGKILEADCNCSQNDTSRTIKVKTFYPDIDAKKLTNEHIGLKNISDNLNSSIEKECTDITKLGKSTDICCKIDGSSTNNSLGVALSSIGIKSNSFSSINKKSFCHRADIEKLDVQIQMQNKSSKGLTRENVKLSRYENDHHRVSNTCMRSIRTIANTKSSPADDPTASAPDVSFSKSVENTCDLSDSCNTHTNRDDTNITNILNSSQIQLVNKSGNVMHHRTRSSHALLPSDHLEIHLPLNSFDANNPPEKASNTWNETSIRNSPSEEIKQISNPSNMKISKNTHLPPDLKTFRIKTSLMNVQKTSQREETEVVPEIKPPIHKYSNLISNTANTSKKSPNDERKFAPKLTAELGYRTRSKTIAGCCINGNCLNIITLRTPKITNKLKPQNSFEINMKGKNCLPTSSTSAGESSKKIKCEISSKINQVFDALTQNGLDTTGKSCGTAISGEATTNIPKIEHQVSSHSNKGIKEAVLRNFEKGLQMTAASSCKCSRILRYHSNLCKSSALLNLPTVSITVSYNNQQKEPHTTSNLFLTHTKLLHSNYPRSQCARSFSVTGKTMIESNNKINVTGVTNPLEKNDEVSSENTSDSITDSEITKCAPASNIDITSRIKAINFRQAEADFGKSSASFRRRGAARVIPFSQSMRSVVSLCITELRQKETSDKIGASSFSMSDDQLLRPSIDSFATGHRESEIDGDEEINVTDTKDSLKSITRPYICLKEESIQENSFSPSNSSEGDVNVYLKPRDNVCIDPIDNQANEPSLGRTLLSSRKRTADLPADSSIPEQKKLKLESENLLSLSSEDKLLMCSVSSNRNFAPSEKCTFNVNLQSSCEDPPNSSTDPKNNVLVSEKNIEETVETTSEKKTCEKQHSSCNEPGTVSPQSKCSYPFDITSKNLFDDATVKTLVFAPEKPLSPKHLRSKSNNIPYRGSLGRNELLKTTRTSSRRTRFGLIRKSLESSLPETSKKCSKGLPNELVKTNDQETGGTHTPQDVAKKTTKISEQERHEKSNSSKTSIENPSKGNASVHCLAGLGCKEASTASVSSERVLGEKKNPPRRLRRVSLDPLCSTAAQAGSKPSFRSRGRPFGRKATPVRPANPTHTGPTFTV